MDAGGSENETEALSNYGFLYGTIPTAPSVFVYATNYAIQGCVLYNLYEHNIYPRKINSFYYQAQLCSREVYFKCKALSRIPFNVGDERWLQG